MTDTRVGQLIFRGGVEIAPDKANIGGISALEWHDGTLFAVTDEGHWMELTPGEIAGRLVDVSEVRLGTLQGANGESLAGKALGDAERQSLKQVNEHLETLLQEYQRTVVA